MMDGCDEENKTLQCGHGLNSLNLQSFPGNLKEAPRTWVKS